jgi:hypothetical protein
MDDNTPRIPSEGSLNEEVRSMRSKEPLDISEVLNTAARLSFSSNDRKSPRDVAASPRSHGDSCDLSKEDMDLLSSLPRQSIASIPSEDDRKRVLVRLRNYKLL